MRIRVHSGALHDFFVGGSTELRDLRSLSIPAGFSDSALNKHGLETVSSGVVVVRCQTLLQQRQQPPAPRGARGGAQGAAAGSKLPFRAIIGARALGASETAADRVRKRLDDRRRMMGAHRAGKGASGVQA